MSNDIPVAEEITIPLFEQLLSETEDEIKQRQLKIARRTLQRRFQSAHDSADTQAMKRQSLIDTQFSRIRKSPVSACETFDVNMMMQYTAELSTFLQQRDAIAEKYEELFGEAIPSI